MTYQSSSLDKWLEFAKRSSLPAYLGDFTSLIGRNADNVIEFTSGLYDGIKLGKAEGYSDGVDDGLKSWVMAGDDQVFLNNKTGEIYPYSSITNELLKSDKTSPLIKSFIDKEKFGYREQEYNDFISDYEQQMEKRIDPNISKKSRSYSNKPDLTIPQQIEQDLERKRLNIVTKYGTIENNKNAILDDIVEIEKLNNERSETLSNLIKSGSNKATTPKKNISSKTDDIQGYKDRLQLRNDLTKEITDYNEMLNKLNLKKVIDNERAQFFNGNKQNFQDAFTKIKHGKVSMLLTDEFNIYDVKNIRKIHGKTNDLQEIHEKLLNKLEDNEYKGSITDYRTNPIDYDKIIDYLKFPKVKSSTNIEKEVRNKFGDRTPHDISKHIQALIDYDINNIK